MKIFLLTLIAVSSIAASAFATDLDDLSDQIDELNSKLDDANEKLDALLPDQVYVAPPKRPPSYVLVPLDPPKPKDIPGGYWVESDNPKIGWHWIKGSPSKSGRFTDK